MNNRITLSCAYLSSQLAKHLIVGSVLTLGLFVSLFAGSDPVPQPEKDVPALPEVKLYDIEFDGGSLVALLKQIMASSKGEINIIWSSEIEDHAPDFPKLSLRKVKEKDLFEVLRAMIRSQTTNAVIMDRSGNVWGVGLDSRSIESLFRTGGSNFMVNFLAIQDVLEVFSLEAVTTAIQTGWELAGLEDESTLKYHPDTKLLVFKGNSEAFNIVMSVLGQLRVQIPKKTSNSGESDAK